jgi:hypothetical protein
MNQGLLPFLSCMIHYTYSLFTLYHLSHFTHFTHFRHFPHFPQAFLSLCSFHVFDLSILIHSLCRFLSNPLPLFFTSHHVFYFFFLQLRRGPHSASGRNHLFLLHSQCERQDHPRPARMEVCNKPSYSFIYYFPSSPPLLILQFIICFFFFSPLTVLLA